MKTKLHNRVAGNTKPNMHASPTRQVWEALDARLGSVGFRSLLDDMKRLARPRKGR